MHDPTKCFLIKILHTTKQAVGMSVDILTMKSSFLLYVKNALFLVKVKMVHMQNYQIYYGAKCYKIKMIQSTIAILFIDVLKLCT